MYYDLRLYERQETHLCALHSINNLLQGKVFTKVQLHIMADCLSQVELDLLIEAHCRTTEDKGGGRYF